MRAITSKELVFALCSTGWTLGKYGHPHKVITTIHPHPDMPQGRRVTVEYRIKPGALTCIVEVKSRRTPTTENPSGVAWTEVERAYYQDVVITSAAQIKIGSRLF